MRLDGPVDSPIMTFTLLERLARGPLLADGAMGTLLNQRGVEFEACFDELNLSRPGLIESIHRDYLAAGAELLETNTFGANAMRLTAHNLEEKVRLIARQGVKIARAAREIVGVNAFVAGSIGPLGKALEPFGVISLTDAEAAFQASAEGLLDNPRAPHYVLAAGKRRPLAIELAIERIGIKFVNYFAPASGDLSKIPVEDF